MNLEQGFLADMVDHPNDDTPRLAYADWLEENASASNRHAERAELIRTHLALSRHSSQLESLKMCSNSTSFVGGVPAKQSRAAENFQRLVRQLYNASRWGVRECTLRRGFIEEANLSLRNWHLFDPVFQTQPIRHLTVKHSSGMGTMLAAIRELEQIETLALGGLLPDDLHRLARRSPLPRLRKLQMHAQRADDVGMLLGSGALPPVRSLQINGHNWPPSEGVSDGLAVVMNWPTAWERDQVPILVRQPFLSQVRDLRLAGYQWGLPVGSVLVESLARASGLTGLERLGLRAGIGDDGLAVLLKAPWMRNLKSLDLRQSGLTDTSARLLIRSEALSGLERLDIAANPITESGWRKLEARFGDALVGRESINRKFAKGSQSVSA